MDASLISRSAGTLLNGVMVAQILGYRGNKPKTKTQ